jgi:hypothetical protein
MVETSAISTSQVILLKRSAGVSSDVWDGVLTFIKRYASCLVVNRSVFLRNVSHCQVAIGKY